jgi:titin
VEALEDRTVPSTFTVTSTADSGPGTLRDAIAQVNADPAGPGVITFDVPTNQSPPPVQVIRPLSPLPAVSRPVVIDGTTQPGYAGSPLVALDGSGAGPSANGLDLQAGDSAVAGLAVYSFAGAGVLLDGGSGDVITADYVGTNAAGTAALANGTGVLLRGTYQAQVGGTEAGAGNLISGNKAAGVEIDGGGDDLLEGNDIGTNAAGTAAVGNGRDGVLLAGSSNDQVGGMDPAAANLIAGNGAYGVDITGGVTGDRVLGNTLGNDGSLTLRGNTSGGVLIASASGNTIGGADAGAGNVISGNRAGVVLNGAGGNLVEGNYLGTDPTGSRPSSFLSFYGVWVQGPSVGNVIGGTAPGAGNLISGNFLDNILLDAGSAGTSIQGNLIGTDVTGTRPIVVRVGFFTNNGILVQRSSGNTVGGTAQGAGNVISGNGGDGLVVTSGPAGQVSAGNVIQGNYIGTDVTGSRPVGNGVGSTSFVHGVWVLNSPDTLIGGATPGAGNVISANKNNGVQVIGDLATGNVIQGNSIGTNADGTAGLGPQVFGVLLGGPNNLLGGTAPGAGNLISGNGTGAEIDSHGNTVQGNLIGTDFSGEAVIGNDVEGVRFLNGSGNLLGGTTDQARNVIAGNSEGVLLYGTSHANLVEGNYIGTDAAGAVALGNTQGVLFARGTLNNVVGGTADGAANLISGNGVGVLMIDAATAGNLVEGNYIGTGPGGDGGLGNSGPGVQIMGASNNQIGGEATGAGNVIAFNGGDGVLVTSGNHDRISGNSIYANGGLGIELNAANNANDQQAAPVLSLAVVQGNTLSVVGTLQSTPNTTFTVEFFASDAGDPSGFGQGQTYLGSAQVTTNASGGVTFLATFAAPEGQFITATATSPQGDTSQFSNWVEVISGGPALAGYGRRHGLDDWAGGVVAM